MDLIITSLETIQGYALNTGAYLFTLDELQNASIAQGQEKVDITGKQGRKLSSLKRNKTVTISGANGMLSGGLLEMQVGSDFENKVADVMWVDFLTVNNNEATTNYKAIGTAGSEIAELYILETSGSVRTELVQDSAASAGKFAYAPATKKLTFSGVADSTAIAVYYKRKITAEVIVNESDKYSRKCELFVDCMAEDKCANVYHVQIHIPKADFSGEFTLDFGGDQTVHNFEAEGLAGACGAGGELWDMIIFGENADDTPAAKKLVSIAITTAPSDTSYTAGESFDPTGMVVKATYDDGEAATTLNPGAYTYAPNGALATTDTAVVISYTEGGITKTASQAITVTAG
jgi:hypothetical protein